MVANILLYHITLRPPPPLKPFKTPNMKCFAKIVNGWIESTIFAERFILDLSLGSEGVSDYPEAFSIIIKWGFHFESFMKFSNCISTLLKYLEQTFSR